MSFRFALPVPAMSLALSLAIGGCVQGTGAAGALETVAETSPATAAAPAPAAPATAPAAPEGTWHLASGGARYVLTLARDEASAGALGGTVAPEGGAKVALDAATWEPSSGRLRVRYAAAGVRVWVDARVAEGVLAGRVARAVGAAEPGAAQYAAHVTGWNADVLDRDLVPRVWDLRAADGVRARVRVDRAASGSLVGTFKVYGRDGVGGGEELEHDLEDVAWDGERLAFAVARGDGRWRFEGEARGRRLDVEAARVGAASVVAWGGSRAEVLSHGIAARSEASAAAWRERARRRLALLTMAGAPAAAGARVVALREQAVPPTAEGARDGYTLTELRFEHTIADPRGGPDVVRAAHGYLARPDAAAPSWGHPLVLAFNGHYGSARAVMDPRTIYGYGDAYARRGYLVLALDVSHRPAADRADLYGDLADGDAPAEGNAAHPAVAWAGMDTDWEEDGERAWDAMRALDYALTRGANPRRVLATGLSMGAEVATLFGALDPRVSAVVSAGFSPDLAVMRRHGNHPCWRWRHGDVEEYVDTSDYHALVAPRPLVVETGRADATFSSLATPFASDKQVLRRSRVAWGDDPRRLVHDLHPGAHVYHLGDPSLDASEVRGVPVPVLVAPTLASPLAWQTDGATALLAATVFDLTRWSFTR